ncbi:MAG: hypothetical protein EOO70_01150 [Myxococcaceae bacterium]|nr:MAG: hypothetical protein EOO70_01150 [Myxococcaceae bacterium]
MIHTILSYGHFDRNFRHLTAETTTYRDKDGIEKEAQEATEKVDGLKFRYMQCRYDEFVAVAVEDVVLRAPVLLIPVRHTDGKGFMSAPYFGDESAMHLLVDMIVANVEKRDVLGRLLRKIGLEKKAGKS